MGGVQVHAHHGAHGFPQAQQRLRVVHQLHGVVLQGDALNAAVRRHVHQFFPLGNRHLVPLVVQDVLGLRRPGGGDPHRRPVAGTPGGQTAHHHDLLHAQLLRQTEGLFRHIPFLFIGQGVAGAVQGAQLDVPAAHLDHPPLPGRFGGHHLVQINMRCAGPVSGADLHSVNVLLRAEIQHLLKGHIQGAGFDGKSHGKVPPVLY